MANIVICADGTWNRPEEDLRRDHPTNVLKLARGISPAGEEHKQHVFYDWGLGSYHDRALGGIAGRGIHKNILDGYRYIVHNYEPGDRIFLFGYSRGAYTVRALCGLINNCGILESEHARRIAEAWRIYKSPARTNHPKGQGAKDFRKYSHDERNVHFVGVWDTVGALGIPSSLMGLFNSHDEFYDNRMGANIAHARHALAIDEKREDFTPTFWRPREEVDLKQIWFAGCHGDVGGGYAPDKKTGKLISDIALSWMLDAAMQAGLTVEEHFREALTYPGPPANNQGLARTHRSRVKVFRMRPAVLRDMNPNDIPTRVHPSVRERFTQDSTYRPKNLVKLLQESNENWDAIIGT